MKGKITTTIRIILTMLLIVGIYTETGVYTTVFAVTISIANELNSYHNKQLIEALTADSNLLNELLNKKTKQ